MRKYDYLIIGPGAMGLFLAANLGHAGLRVAILDYKPERAKILKKNGINLITADKIISIPIIATCNPQIVMDSQVCIVISKAYNTADVAQEIKEHLDGNTIISIQNGLGNVETLAEILGDNAEIIAGSTTQGALLENINTVRDTGTGTITIGNNSVKSNTIKEEFNKANLNTEISSDINKVLFGKAIINSAINPLGALTKRKNGELLLSAEILQLMQVIITESTTVAANMGVDLSSEEYYDKVISICKATAWNTNSMLKDIINNKRTEIDAINGKNNRIRRKIKYPRTG